MRIYEFAKKHSVPSADLVQALKEAGFDVKNHMSALSAEAVSFCEKKFLKIPVPPAEPGKARKQPTTPILPTKKAKKAPAKKIGAQRARGPERRARKAQEVVELVVPESIQIRPLSVLQAAQELGQPVNDVILTLLRWGVAAAINQVLSEELVGRLAEHYQVEGVGLSREIEDIDTTQEGEPAGDLKERRPIVVVMGHVDHGKTTLLDYIRQTRVAARERGGITQHLGAYEAVTSHGNLVFLDTPGHEAFPKIRQRGAKVADIAVIVIAGDDGMMPQTVEAIKHARKMNLPIMVAINKIDKATPEQIERVKRQLAEHDLLPEEWGGQVVCVPISAKEGTGVDQLLEMLILQAQLMELAADYQSPAKGFILESKLAKGYGPVATLIPQHGSIVLGDYFICGNTSGRVTVLTDSIGQRLKTSGPAIPVQVSGFEFLPEAGDFFEVVSKERYLAARSQLKEKRGAPRHISKETGSINIVLKADSDSSKEALIDSIRELSKKNEIGFTVLDARVGDVSEGDVELAFNTGSEIVGFHVKASPKATELAKQRKVPLGLFFIIYELIDALQDRLERDREVEMVRVKIGQATVRKVFNIKNAGVIAGCYVNEGRIDKNGFVVGMRGNTVIGEAKIVSLQREKKNVKEVHAGFECGIVVDSPIDWQEDDTVECYIEQKKAE